jgi:hypothetical protein
MIRKSNIIESFLLGLGLSVAFIVLLNMSDIRSKSLTNSGVHISATPQASDESSNDEQVVAFDVTGNIPAVVHVEGAREFLCLFSILFVQDIFIPDYKPDVPLPLTKFFLTLFRTVISPNAP